MVDGPSELVHRFIGAMNRGQLEELMELFEEDAVLDAGPRFEEPFIGRPAIRGLFEAYLRSLSELTLILRDVYSNGPRAVATLEIFAVTTASNPDPAHFPDWNGSRRVSWKGAYHFALSPGSRIGSLSVYGDDSGVRWVPLHGLPSGAPRRYETPAEPVSPRPAQ
jgi:ketosteroid isomerase-like protein